MSDIIIDGDKSAPLFVFAHGAGAGMEHSFMSVIAQGLAKKWIQVLRFDFPYMQKRRLDGKKRPPDRAPKLLEHFQAVIDQHTTKPVVIGGKSMGGRMASLLADKDLVSGVACLGFPFHPPGKPEKYKGEHLAELTKPCLILQGERDTFGKKEEVEQFELAKSISVDYLPDGDHSFKPRKASGFTEEQNLDLAIEKLSQFIFEVSNAS